MLIVTGISKHDIKTWRTNPALFFSCDTPRIPDHRDGIYRTTIIGDVIKRLNRTSKSVSKIPTPAKWCIRGCQMCLFPKNTRTGDENNERLSVITPSIYKNDQRGHLDCCEEGPRWQDWRIQPIVAGCRMLPAVRILPVRRFEWLSQEAKFLTEKINRGSTRRSGSRIMRRKPVVPSTHVRVQHPPLATARNERPVIFETMLVLKCLKSIEATTSTCIKAIFVTVNHYL